MKKAIFGLTILILVYATSCTKSPNAGGSWTFKGLTYDVTTCAKVGNTLAASSSTNTNITTFGGLVVYFPGTSLPTTSGVYAVVDTTPVGNQVNIAETINGTGSTLYWAGGASHGNPTVNVTVANGRVTVSGSNIIMLNDTSAADTGALTLNIYNAGN
jgi:osmotically-inducible protein OsmY